MTALHIQTPSRLHFGLLGWGPLALRQFGGVGLMIQRPGLELVVEPALDWSAEGPLADRALSVLERLRAAGVARNPCRVVVHASPRPHLGFGVGTQLSLAVTLAALKLEGHEEQSAETLAPLSGRGLRSGIGLHGFLQGGLIVDGGRGSSSIIPPLLARLSVPPAWKVLILVPDSRFGMHGPAEVQAFASLPAIPDTVTDRLCRLVLLGLLPAIREEDLPTFGKALEEIQEWVGRSFAPAQGGVFARPELAKLVDQLRAEGLHGVGQSSWGPALYAFSDEPEPVRIERLDSLRRRLGLAESSLFWTSVSETGAVVRCLE